MHKNKEKLKFLLEDWIEHNGEHKNHFHGWIQKAKSMGMDGVTKNLANAVDSVDEIKKILRCKILSHNSLYYDSEIFSKHIG